MWRPKTSLARPYKKGERVANGRIDKWWHRHIQPGTLKLAREHYEIVAKTYLHFSQHLFQFWTFVGHYK